MAVQKIDEIIDVAAVQEQGKILRDELTKSQQKLVEVYDLIQKYKSASFSESAKDAKALAAALNESAKATDAAAKANINFEKTLQAQAKTKEALARASAAQAKEEQAVIKLIDQEITFEKKRSAERQRAIDAANKQKDAYEQLKIQYNKTAAQAKAFGIQLGIESKEFLETASAAQKYYTQLLTVEKAVGQGQRQVGQYENATRGLHGSINQITRELPAFTYSIQTGFLAISNNLPILFDEIGKISAQNKELAAQGKKTQSVLKSVVSGIFSFGTVLSVAVTLLSVYGKEIGDFFSSLFKSSEKLDDIVQGQETYNNIVKETSSTIQSVGGSIVEMNAKIDAAKLGLLEQKDVLKEYNEGIGKTIGSARDLAEMEQLLNDKAPAFIQLTLLKAKAQAAVTLANQTNIKLLEAQAKRDAEFLSSGDAVSIGLKNFFRPGDPSVLLKEGTKQANENRKVEISKQEDFLQRYNNLIEKYTLEAAAFAKDNGLDLYTDDKKNSTLKNVKDALFEAQKLEIEGRIQAAQLIAANDQKTFAERITAQQQMGREEIALINLSAAHEITQEDKTAQEKKNIRTKAAQDRIATETETNGSLRDLLNAQAAFELDIITTLAERRAKEAQEADKIAGKIQERAKNIQEASQITITILDAQYAKEQKIALENYRAGLLSKEEYEQTLLDIQVKFSDAALVEVIEAAKQRLKLLKVGSKEYVDAQKAIADAELARIKLTEDAEKKSLDKRKKNVESFLNGVNDITRNLTSAINAIFDVGFDRRSADLETQQNQLEESSEREIENITNSTLSEEEKQRRIQIAQATTDAKKQEIERRQRQIEMERARFQKAVDIANIITGTAVAVVAALGMKPYTPLNIALAAATGAAGAAQLAAAIATPLPKFKHGTSNAPEGWALTDEAGAEGYIEPGGKKYIGNDTPTVRYIKRGTKIIPHDELNKSIGINSMLLDIAGIISKPAAGTIDYSNANKNTDRIVKAIRSTRVKQQATGPDLGRIGYLLKNVYQ